MYCSNRLSLLRLSASDHSFTEYKQSILHPPTFCYSTRDTQSYFDWTIALDRSCPSSKREYFFVLPEAQSNRNNGSPTHPSKPLRKSADRWIHNAKEYANQLLSRSSHSNIQHVKHLGNDSDVLHDVHDVVYALNALTPVMSSDVPKVIYVKQDKTLAKQHQQPHSASTYAINKYMSTSHHSVKGKTIHVNRATPPYDDQTSTSPKVRVIHVSAPRPLPRIAKQSRAFTRHAHDVTDRVTSPHSGSRTKHGKMSLLLHENPRPITITHMVMTSSSHAGEPIPVTHMVRNNPKSPQLLAVRGSTTAPHREPDALGTVRSSKQETVAVPYAIVDEPEGGRRVVSLKRLNIELGGGAPTEHHVAVTTERSDTRNLKPLKPKSEKPGTSTILLNGLKATLGEEAMTYQENVNTTTTENSFENSIDHPNDNELTDPPVQRKATETAAGRKAFSPNDMTEHAKYSHRKSPTKDIEFDSIGDLLAYVHDNIFQFPSKPKEKAGEGAGQIRLTNTQENHSETVNLLKKEKPAKTLGHAIFDNYVTVVDNKDSGSRKREDEKDTQQQNEVSDLLHVLDEQEEHVSKGVDDGTSHVLGRVQDEQEDNRTIPKEVMAGLSDMLDVLNAQETRLGDSWKKYNSWTTNNEEDN